MYDVLLRYPAAQPLDSVTAPPTTTDSIFTSAPKRRRLADAPVDEWAEFQEEMKNASSSEDPITYWKVRLAGAYPEDQIST